MIKNLIADQLATANSGGAETDMIVERVLAGPVRTMSLTLDKIEDEARALQAALVAGASVVELDPGHIDASFASDRFSDGDTASFESLKASIRENGQEVPVLVRPHPQAAGRFQAAYGHRRLAAARDLGIKVRAVVRTLSDEQLVVAQGVENSARQDLSFIEKAVFAAALEKRAFPRSTIMAALSTDKTELSKLLNAANSVPEPVIRLIGAAPKAGRRRWLQLASLLQKGGSLKRAQSALAGCDRARVDSDGRFILALAAAQERADLKHQTKPPPVTPWNTPEGVQLGRIVRSGGSMTIRIDEKAEPRFAEFLIAELDALLIAFRSRRI